MLLPEFNFLKINQDVLSSMEEYFTYDLWNKEDLIQLPQNNVHNV